MESSEGLHEVVPTVGAIAAGSAFVWDLHDDLAVQQAHFGRMGAYIDRIMVENNSAAALTVADTRQVIPAGITKWASLGRAGRFQLNPSSAVASGEVRVTVYIGGCCRGG